MTIEIVDLFITMFHEIIIVIFIIPSGKLT